MRSPRPAPRARTPPVPTALISAPWHRTEKHGDHAPENADLYFAYGKALLEHAIAQSSVLGKEEPTAGDDDGARLLCPLPPPSRG